MTKLQVIFFINSLFKEWDTPKLIIHNFVFILVSFPVNKRIDPLECQVNLLAHIDYVQTQLTHRLDFLEDQVTRKLKTLNKGHSL